MLKAHPTRDMIIVSGILAWKIEREIGHGWRLSGWQNKQAWHSLQASSEIETSKWYEAKLIDLDVLLSHETYSLESNS
jgi:hypothetical protein